MDLSFVSTTIEKILTDSASDSAVTDSCYHSISQSVDFKSGLSGATTARTTNWMMSGYNYCLGKNVLTVDGRWTVNFLQRRQLAVDWQCIPDVWNRNRKGSAADC